MSVPTVHAGVVGQLVALLVPGAGHSADAEVVQDAAPALQQPCLLVTRGAAGQPSELEILILGCWAGHTAGWDEVEHCRGHQRTHHY